MANATIAYILWFFLGFLGVHHFYLRRDRHAFVMWATCGGVFGLGWLRDLFHLSDYIDECNADDDTYISDTINDEYRHARRVGKPKVSFARFAGMMLMGMNLGYLVMVACPPEWLERKDIVGIVFRYVLPTFAVATGVHLVANIGNLQTTKNWPLLGACVGDIWLFKDPTNIPMVALMSSIATWWKGVTWKPQPKPRRGLCIRVSKLVLFGTIYLMMWGASIYYNAKIQTRDGEEVPLRVAVNNFFKSPAWTETKEALHRLWEHIRVNGWSRLFEEIIQAIDPEGESNAYKVLGLKESATQEEIKVRYRKLAKEWHPDKHTDPEKREQAQVKFMEIQEAYETLSSIKARRTKQNKKSAKPHSESHTHHTEF